MRPLRVLHSPLRGEGDCPSLTFSPPPLTKSIGPTLKIWQLFFDFSDVHVGLYQLNSIQMYRIETRWNCFFSGETSLANFKVSSPCNIETVILLKLFGNHFHEYSCWDKGYIIRIYDTICDLQLSYATTCFIWYIQVKVYL